jgi:xylulokinase
MEQAFGYTFEAVNTIGGGARNHFWQAMKASIFNRPIELPDVAEATSKGAALLAGIGIGVYRDLYDASKRTHQVKRRFEPEPEFVQQYNSIFAIYKQIYPALKNINSQIDTLCQ